MSYGYAPFAPIFHYSSSAGSFVGGNFWDERATGEITGNPAGDQALGPPLNPVEMALPDAACVIRRIAQSPYANLFRQVWGADSLTVSWPSNIDNFCSKPAQSFTPKDIVKLDAADRNRVTQSYSDMGLAIAAYEAGPDVSPFSSKFDFYLAGKTQLTPVEKRGLTLFNGKGNCNQCHVSSGSQPMFTDFTAVNLGLPKNLEIPFHYEDKPDGYGFVANPAGPGVTDEGLGKILAESSNPDWKAKAPQFLGTFQVATLRNVDRRPRPGYIKAYFHNGYFKSLKDVVHFYNTRDVLPVCRSSSDENAAIGKTCYPPPEVPRNVNHSQTGNLGLTSSEEDAIVAFLHTLTDGYEPGRNN
jgi:cytochrome c peroxidase